MSMEKEPAFRGFSLPKEFDLRNSELDSLALDVTISIDNYLQGNDKGIERKKVQRLSKLLKQTTEYTTDFNDKTTRKLGANLLWLHTVSTSLGHNIEEEVQSGSLTSNIYQLTEVIAKELCPYINDLEIMASNPSAISKERGVQLLQYCSHLCKALMNNPERESYSRRHYLAA